MPPKNILLLMTDQHRLDHVGYMPDARLETPNLNRLAEGTAFTNCITVNPICTPMRTALVTGRYTHQIGTLAMAGDLSRQHPTFMRALQNAGYHTSGVGKLHFMQTWPWNTPRGKRLDLHGLKGEILRYGYDELWETAGKQLMTKSYCDYAKHLDDKGLLDTYLDFVEAAGGNSFDAHNPDTDVGEPFPLDEADYMDVLTGDRIVERIRQRPSDRPFYIFGSFCSPHKPFDPPRRYLDMVPYEEFDDFVPGAGELTLKEKQALWRKRRAYKAMIRLVDDQVGRIVDTLEEEGLLDDTVVLFTSDHGEMLGDHGRLQKSIYYKESVNVPCIVRHPDYLDGRRIDSPVETGDLAATILDVAGLNPREALSMPWPGFQSCVPCRSLMPLVKGETVGSSRVDLQACKLEYSIVSPK